MVINSGNQMLEYNFDSSDEEFFWNWLRELLFANLIEVKTDRQSFKLNNGRKYSLLLSAKSKKQTILKPIENDLIKEKTYTPDFIFRFLNDERFTVNLSKTDLVLPKSSLITSHDGWCYVDVKGAFTRNITSSITFPDRQVMMMDKHNIFVNKVVCHDVKATDTKGKCLFKETFVPQTFVDYSIRKVNSKNGTKGETKIKYKIKTLNEWING